MHTYERTEESTHIRAQRRKTDPKTGKDTLCEPAQSKRTWTCHKSTQEPFCVEIYRKKAGPILCGNLQEKGWTPILGIAFCASLRSRNAHGHFTRAILCGNLEEKWRTPFLRMACCASLRRRNTQGNFTRAIFCSSLQEKMPHTTLPTSIEHRALTGTVKTPQCGHTVWRMIFFHEISL